MTSRNSLPHVCAPVHESWPKADRTLNTKTIFVLTTCCSVAQVAQGKKTQVEYKATKPCSVQSIRNSGAMEFYLQDGSPVAAPFPGQDNRDYGDQAAAYLN